MIPNVERVDTLPALKTALAVEGWDAIICDYNLPQFTAIDALSIVRGLRPEVPCIVVSGSIGEEKAIETMKAGASDYIMKDNLTRLVPVLQRELKEATLRKESRSAEETLRKSEENLRQAQKLDSIGQLAGGIAHDFNNLLATIMIQSEVLKESLDDKLTSTQLIDIVGRGLDQILKSGERASNLTRQLLAFSRKQVLQPKVVSLNDLIIDMGTMLRRLIEEHIEFRTQLGRDLHNIKIDPVHLEQVLLNLIVNARDAMPKGGKLIIETANTTLDLAQARSHNIKPGRYVMLEVIDTGTGLSDEAKKHMFEPFFTTKPLGKGTGLGLSTVYGIVKQNHGSIAAESEKDRGTSFKIYFPVVDEEVHTMVQPVKETSSTKGSETVLVVEDEDVLRELICDSLKSSGYKVINAPQGARALELAASETKIDLVITDVVMPQMSGPDLAKRIAATNKSCKFLFQSGYAEDALADHDFDDPHMHFLAKPYTLKDLLRHVRHILDS